MKFLIITHAEHFKQEQTYSAYAPYVQEMNLWLKYVDSVEIVAPLVKVKHSSPINISYQHNNIKVNTIPQIKFTSIGASIASFFKLPYILFLIFKACKKTDHIHIRCPGNIGLLGCFVQAWFPKKPKTVKYAGNWDPKSKQPWSYQIQKWILKNEFLTRNTQVLVYGNWKEPSKNIHPFFTASYKEEEKIDVEPKPLKDKIGLLFVGTLNSGKRPLLSVQIVKELVNLNHNVHLDIYGEGQQRNKIEAYVSENNLSNFVTLHGNKDKETLKKAYQKAHFLVFMSKSEGWPKVVAEAMFWKCLPISTNVSCIPEMLNQGKRGSLIQPKLEAIINEFNFYVNNAKIYKDKVEKAYIWSRTYTLDKFETEIPKLLSKL